jgi:hypothetical protein
MRRRVGVLAALVAVSAVLVALPSPAGAETVVQSYERGNAPATIDITRLRVMNGDHRFAMQVKVRDLRKEGRFSFYYWPGRHGTPPPHSVILVVRHDAAGLHQRFLTCGREDCSSAPCRSFRASWRPGDDVVRVSARQRCLPGTRVPGAGRFSASAATETDADTGAANVLVERG